MATHTGKEGVVQVGAAAIAEIRNFSIEESSDTVEDSSMGDDHRTYKPTLRSWNASVDCWWDESDTTGQLTLVPGTEVTITVAPEGTASGAYEYTGSAIVTGRNVTSQFDGMVEATITLQGTGALTAGT